MCFQSNSSRGSVQNNSVAVASAPPSGKICQTLQNSRIDSRRDVRVLKGVGKRGADLDDLEFSLWLFGRSGVMIMNGGDGAGGERRIKRVDVPTITGEQIQETSTSSVERLVRDLLCLGVDGFCHGVAFCYCVEV